MHIKKHVHLVTEFTEDNKIYFSQYVLWFLQENNFFSHVITVVLVRTSHL